MNNLYQILDELRSFLLLSDFTNMVTFGEISAVDLQKTTNFSLVHISIDSVDVEENFIDFNLTLVACDIVDVSKDETVDIFLGNNNLQDILNAQLSVITTASNYFRRADLVTNNFIMITDVVSATPFLDNLENQLAGWEASVTLRSAMQDKC